MNDGGTSNTKRRMSLYLLLEIPEWNDKPLHKGNAVYVCIQVGRQFHHTHIITSTALEFLVVYLKRSVAHRAASGGRARRHSHRGCVVCDYWWQFSALPGLRTHHQSPASSAVTHVSGHHTRRILTRPHLHTCHQIDVYMILILGKNKMYQNYPYLFPFLLLVVY